MEWTPVPIPKPLYLSRAAVESPIMEDSEEQLRIAAINAAAELRAAQAASKVVPIVPAAAASSITQNAPTLPAARPEPAARQETAAPQASTPPSRFAGMGVIDPKEVGGTDLDAVLRRRRQAS